MANGLAPEIVRELTSRYGLTNCKPRLMAGGFDDRASSWCLDCDSGRFVGRLDRDVSMGEAGWLADIERRVFEAGVRCAPPLAAKDGSFAFSIQAGTVTLRPFVGQPLDIRAYDSAQLSTAGSVLGNIHCTDVRGLPQRPDRADPANFAGVHRDLRLPVDWQSSTLFDLRIMHGDFWAENLLWDKGRVAVIDWSGARLGDPVSELAFSAWTFGQDERSKLDPTRARAFLAGYSAVRGPWTPVVRAALIPLMRECVRDYICDVGHDDAEYRADLEREFHRLREQDPRALLDP